ncbi:MAG: hypothetical protein AB7V42_15770 [Thermoleophilia bacterium]
MPRIDLRDAAGTRYAPRALLVKLADTIARTLVVVGILYAIAGLWEAFH